MTSDRIPVLGAEQIRALLRPRDAVQAVEDALRAGLDPAGDPARAVVPTAHGQFLLMPSEAQAHAGVKVATVAPDNPARARPRIQGLYLLFDAATLSPVAVLDGIALTTLRTPAVSVAAVRPFLLGDDHPLAVAVFGAGPQAVGHVATLIDALDGHRRVARVTYLVRRPEAATVPAHGTIPVTLAAAGPTQAATAATGRMTASGVGGGRPTVEQALAEADVIVCATTARRPLFDSGTVRNEAIVIAVGSHEPDAREVDGALTARAHVVVEDVATASREAGDVVQAIDEGHLQATDLIPLREVVTGPRPAALDRPVLFKSTGMSWEDLVVATAVHHRIKAPG